MLTNQDLNEFDVILKADGKLGIRAKTPKLKTESNHATALLQNLMSKDHIDLDQLTDQEQDAINDQIKLDRAIINRLLTFLHEQIEDECGLLQMQKLSEKQAYNQVTERVEKQIEHLIEADDNQLQLSIKQTEPNLNLKRLIEKTTSAVITKQSQAEITNLVVKLIKTYHAQLKSYSELNDAEIKISLAFMDKYQDFYKDQFKAPTDSDDALFLLIDNHSIVLTKQLADHINYVLKTLND